jgi:cytochrome c oxidase assembly protein subunit 15
VAAVLTLAAPARRGFYRPLLVAATLLAFCVVGLGAYVRLADAGLGCPDWPGCYGHLVGVPDAAAAAAAFPERPLETAKAWKEMLHRYAAGMLGLLILGLAISAWRNAGAGPRPWRETGLVALVIFQALLGMWTVTLLLKPVVVTAHLLGGMATWTLLVLCLARECAPKVGAGGTVRPDARGLGILGLVAVIGQVALGGWVSSNYAALACPDFPTCRGGWLPIDGPTAIHMAHRLGALLVLCIVGAHTALLLKRRQAIGLLLAVLLVLQVGLGIANVLLSLPLPLAVAHNLGAALLLAALAVSLRR